MAARPAQLRRRSTMGLALGAAAGVLAIAMPARAQTHWDAGALAGATERIATASGAPARFPGPSAEIHGHVALYPLVRVGAYGTFELSPTSGMRDRVIYGGGGRVKLTPPLLPAAWHVWAFLGVGFATAQILDSRLSTSTAELPVGLGLGRKLSGPWDLCAELAARLDIAGFSWHAPVALPPVASAGGDNLSGGDVLAVSLSVGVSLAP